MPVSQDCSSEWKVELTKLLIFACSAVAVLAVFFIYPTFYVVLWGVLMIAGAAYLTEGMGGYVQISLAKRAVLITGCDTGFGHELAVHLGSLGVTTFAGCLNSKGPGAQKLQQLAPAISVLQMDVTSDQQVSDAVKQMKEVLQKEKKELWGVVNNAGLNFLGDVELTTMSQYERCVQINQLGMIRVTKAVLPLIRASSGRVVNVTSVKGTFAEPFNAAYAATKFAGEAFSDALRREMRGFGVKVAIIEPCNFGGATDCVNEDRMKNDFDAMWNEATEEVKKTYGREYLDHHNDLVKNAIPTSCFEVSRVTKAIVHSLTAEHPRTRYLINGSSGWIDIYWLRSKLVHILPTSLFDAWLRRDLAANPKPAGYIVDE